jgi:hypothetical protein
VKTMAGGASLRIGFRGVEQAARRLSPRRRRWERFLRELPVDPDRFDESLEPPGPDDFIICGCSRTGTTLLSGTLFQPPGVITVMEPWDGMRFPVGELFMSLRSEIDRTGHLFRGRLDIHRLVGQGAIAWCREGDASVNLDPTGSGYQLGVKWPIFWRYLHLLPKTRFIVCLRHPAEVIESFERSGGRLAQGLNYDTAFNRSMNRFLESSTEDPEVRRVLLFDYVHERLLPYLERPNVFVVRYERWFNDHDRLIHDLGNFLGTHLNSGYPAIRLPRSGARSSPRTLELIRAHSRTADKLGYTLESNAR